MDSIVKKSINRGIVGGFLLLAFYFGVLTLANSFSHAVSQFSLLWYWILTLVIGFGIQVGLWFYIYFKIKEKAVKGITGEIAATGGISAGSMIACCAHHLVDVAPLLGLSALFLFLAQYQIFFLILGILSNIIGIILMLEIIQKHSLYQEDSILHYLTKINFKNLKKITIVVAVIVLFISFFGVKNWSKNKSVQNSRAISNSVINNLQMTGFEQTISLPTKSNDSGGLSIEATPIDFSFDQPVQFEIVLITHQGDLDFDLNQQSVLVDDLGNTYLPLEWQGGRGGHHLSGTLIFPQPKEGIKQFKLVIKDIYNVGERIFEWNLE